MRPFSVCRPRRSVRGLPTRGPFRLGIRPYLVRGATQRRARSRLAHAVFRASRFRAENEGLVGGSAARAGHSWPPFLSAHVPGPRIGLLSRPGRFFVSRQRSWGSRPFAVLIPSCARVMSSFDASRPHAVLPFAAASFIVAGTAGLFAVHGHRAAAPGVWPRRDEPYRVSWRPRYSFCAEGRASGSPAEYCLGLYRPLSGIGCRAAGLHFWRTFRAGFGRRPGCVWPESHRGASACPHDVRGHGD